MTTNHTTLRATTAHLADGTPVVLCIEQDPHAITILITDETNQDLAHVQASSHGHRKAAELVLRTEPFMRRRGVAGVALTAVVAWAQRHGVPFLVGELPADEPGARAFLLSLDHPVALRSFDGEARFALLVPRVPHALVAEDVAAFERAEAALESGASLNEAEALYDRLVAA